LKYRHFVLLLAVKKQGVPVLISRSSASNLLPTTSTFHLSNHLAFFSPFTQLHFSTLCQSLNLKQLLLATFKPQSHQDEVRKHDRRRRIRLDCCRSDF
jgi:hypothetical protein